MRLSAIRRPVPIARAYRALLVSAPTRLPITVGDLVGQRSTARAELRAAWQVSRTAGMAGVTAGRARCRGECHGDAEERRAEKHPSGGADADDQAHDDHWSDGVV